MIRQFEIIFRIKKPKSQLIRRVTREKKKEKKINKGSSSVSGREEPLYPNRFIALEVYNAGSRLFLSSFIANAQSSEIHKASSLSLPLSHLLFAKFSREIYEPRGEITGGSLSLSCAREQLK